MRDKDGKYFSIGDINDRITIQAGEPVLHYDNGSYHTSVHFKCASIKSVHGMYFSLKTQKYPSLPSTQSCIKGPFCGKLRVEKPIFG